MIDTLLSQPLAPVPDAGFSVQILLRLRRAEERRCLLLWGAAALALLPVMLALPLVPAGMDAANVLAQMARTPLFASAAGAAVLLWALKPACSRFF